MKISQERKEIKWIIESTKSQTQTYGCKSSRSPSKSGFFKNK